MLEGECGAWTRAQLQALAVEASTFQPTKHVYEELALPLTMTAPLFCPHSTATKHCPLGLADFCTCYRSEAWFCSARTCYDHTKGYRVVKLVEGIVSFKKLAKNCFWHLTCYFIHLCKFNLKCFK